MEPKWTVGSVNGQSNGKEGEWTSLEQILGTQTLLINNVLGISFRIVQLGENYTIGQVGSNPANIYLRLMRKAGINTEEALSEIKKQLTKGEWTATNVKGLLDYGIVEGISTRLDLEDKEKGFEGQLSRKFLDNKDVATMGEIEQHEFYYLKDFTTPEEKLKYLASAGKDSSDFVYQKYKEMVEEPER